MTPEQQARQEIDHLLKQAGWQVQRMKEFNPGAALGVAVAEYPTDSGPADYILFVDRKPVGVIEAKPEGTVLSAVEEQTERYASSSLKWQLLKEPLQFLYQSSGKETYFTDNGDPKPRAREVFAFHLPETLYQWMQERPTLRHRLHQFPELSPEGLRDCQHLAISKLEKSFADNKPRALIQMATGAGKTFTAITFVYRLLKYAKAKRILFLVDTRNLGEQAEQEFQTYTPTDDLRKFPELYTLQRLCSSFIDPNAQVCISTIQRMYAILKGEELDERAEDISQYEVGGKKEALPVVYNAHVPIETFDFIIIDECHRSIYNLWKQVLDYFDAFLIGLTATPDKRTFGFFFQNVVSEYTYEQSVADGVNVGYDIFEINTNITQQGGRIEAKEWVDRRDRLTRRKTWEELDEPVEYQPNQLDKQVVNPDQIRTILTAYRDLLPSIFPGRKEAEGKMEVPKTLIFAKTDSHAEDIIRICREVFAEENKFCKKITYGNTEEKPSVVLQQFRTAYYPRIAVTVDMIATGTDVKAIECLLFMRDVRSRSYFEQMKGRGTRTIAKDALLEVSAKAHTGKTHFVIVDAVGVCQTLKTDSRPLERARGESLMNLMMQAVMGAANEDILTSLANRLARLGQQLTPAEKQKVVELSEGKTIEKLVHGLLQPYNPDRLEAHRVEAMAQMPEAAPQDIENEVNRRQQQDLQDARTPFDSPELRNYLENARKMRAQIIDDLNKDEVLYAGWATASAEMDQDLLTDFAQYLQQHADELLALQLFYSQPYRRRELTSAMVTELCEALKAAKPAFAPLNIWRAWQHLHDNTPAPPKNELVALISLLRALTGLDATLTPYDQVVHRNFQEWAFRAQAGSAPKFTEQQMAWLHLMRDHIAVSFHLHRDELELGSFAQKGGLMGAWKTMGDRLDSLIDELNEALVA